MNYSQALNSLDAGERVSREGWNGKHMWVTRQEGYPNGVPINANTAKATGIPEGTLVKILPYFTLYTVHGELVPWVASQTDQQANDWGVVTGPAFHHMGSYQKGEVAAPQAQA